MEEIGKGHQKIRIALRTTFFWSCRLTRRDFCGRTRTYRPKTRLAYRSSTRIPRAVVPRGKTEPKATPPYRHTVIINLKNYLKYILKPPIWNFPRTMSSQTSNQTRNTSSFSTISSELDDPFLGCEDCLRVHFRRERPRSFRVARSDSRYGKLGVAPTYHVDKVETTAPTADSIEESTTLYHIKLHNKRFRRFSQAASITIKQQFSRMISLRQARPI